MLIRDIQAQDTEEVARIHIEAIATGFISSLGLNFVGTLYREICNSEVGFGYVAEENSKVIGFITGAMDVSKLYKEIVFKKGFLFIMPLIKYFFRLATLKRIAESLFYPYRVKNDYCKAEILAVGVKKEHRGKGVGKKLMEAVIEGFRKRGIKEVKALTHDENEPSNQYYLNQGFKPIGKIKHHENYLNIYQINL
ncbi:GNAT family N-acetyltransferase [Patescibacteria group bacterium]|nr:GNAT family N-acetyltransferase [Patescibacteria group bacterium]